MSFQRSSQWSMPLTSHFAFQLPPILPSNRLNLRVFLMITWTVECGIHIVESIGTASSSHFAIFQKGNEPMCSPCSQFYLSTYLTVYLRYCPCDAPNWVCTFKAISDRISLVSNWNFQFDHLLLLHEWVLKRFRKRLHKSIRERLK